MSTRRQFIAATACGLSLPWLEALAGEKVQPKARCVFIHVPFGVNMWRWFPKGLGKDADFGETLSPLQHLRSKITVFSGLRHPGSGGHMESGFFLTGNPSIGGLGGTAATTGNTISIDQHIALQRGQETGMSSLVLSVAGGQETTSFDKSGTRLYGLFDLPVIYSKLFGSPEAAAQTKRHQSVLKTINSRLKGMQGMLGREDQRRLSQFTDAVSTVDAQLGRDRTYYEHGAQAFLSKAPELSLSGDRLHAIGRENYINTFYDLAALALHSDRTRIVSIESPFSSGRPYFSNYPELFPKEPHTTLDWHQAGHYLSMKDENETLGNAIYLQRIDRYWVSKLARFLDRLNAIEYQDGTLLDHTVVLYGSGMSWGNHSNDQLPLLIAGGSALGIRHKVHLGYNEKAPEGATTPKSNHSDLLRTISEVCGVPAQGFGISTRVLDEILT